MPGEAAVKESFWGEEIDREATKQLGLDGNHTVFMMANESDFIDDLQELAEKLEEDGNSLMSPHEFIGAIEGSMRRVKLPNGFRMVGLTPVGATEPKTYGVVNLTAQGYK